MTSLNLPHAHPGRDPDLVLEALQTFYELYTSRDDKILSLDHDANLTNRIRTVCSEYRKAVLGLSS